MAFKLMLLILLVLCSLPADSRAAECGAALWPADTVAGALDRSPDSRKALFHQAEKALSEPAAPVSHLRSAGVRDKSDPLLKASRRAFRDADHAAITALAYAASGEQRFLLHARAILLDWARVHQPAGHPIDETRLEGLVWSYAIVCRHLSDAERKTITRYFENLYQRKQSWSFGPHTSKNNHRTHQLKIEVLLETLFGWSERQEQTRREIAMHLSTNLDAVSGVSRDYLERDALYYHVYNLEPWLEIALLSGCCRDELQRAFWFAGDRLLAGETGGEFANSSAGIDRARADAGFAYAQRDAYDPLRAARIILVYQTLYSDRLPAQLASIPAQAGTDPRLTFFRVRRLVWMQR